MTPDTHSDTEERVIAAMRSLADVHEPQSQPLSSARRGGERRWVLGAAAAAVLAVGVGALLVAAGRDTDRSADRLPEPDPTTIPTVEPISADALPNMSGPDIDSTPFSPTPLADDILPVLVPAPPGPATAFDFVSLATDWVSGIEQLGLFAVHDNEGAVVGAVQVFDTAAPWATVSEGKDVIDIGGLPAAQVDGDDGRGFLLRVGTTARGVLDTSSSSSTDALPFDDLADLAVLLADQPLEDFIDTDRFVRAPVDDNGGRGTTYGENDSIQLLHVRLTSVATNRTIRLMDELYRLSIDQNDSAQFSGVVQVSPVDLVIIVVDDPDELDAARASLALVPQDESGIDIQNFGIPDGEVVARGEPAWGRWQVTADPVDSDCWFFNVRIWSADGFGSGRSDCGGLNPVRADGSRVFCTLGPLEIVGVVVGATTSPEFAVGNDIVGLGVDREDSADATSFRVSQAEPGANVRAATVLVDGAEISCED